MPTEPDWRKLLDSFSFDLPSDGQAAPPQEYIPQETFTKPAGNDPNVVLQKIVTEIWVYTDVDGKTYATTSFQDIISLGEMPKSEAVKIIGDRKAKRRKKSE